MRMFQVLLIFCIAASICFGARGQGITGTLTVADILNAPYESGAIIYLIRNNQFLGHDAISDENGVFLIEGIAVGIYDVLIIADGMGKKVVPDVVVASENIVDLGTLPLQLECSVSGTVTDPSGENPISGAIAILTSNSEYSVLGSSISSNENGYYNFKQLSPGNYSLTVLVDGQIIGEESIGFTQSAQHRFVLPITLPSFGSISGKVTKADAETGIQDVSVSIYEEEEFIRGGITDVEGIFVIENIPQGIYTVSATSSGYNFPESKENIPVLCDQITTNIDFVAASVGEIAGTIYGNETPLDNAFVYLLEDEKVGTITNKNGEYTLKFVEPGIYTVAARHDGYNFSNYAGVIVTAEESTNGIDLIGEAHGRITGSILEADMHTPIPGARATASEYGNSGMVDENGFYEIIELPAGNYEIRITIQTDSHTSTLGFIDNVTVIGGQTTEEQKFVSPEGSISGWVKDASNTPVVGALVEASMERISVFGETDEYGNYYIPYLQEGIYTLKTLPNQNGLGANEVEDVQVLSGQNTGGQNIVLSAAGSISGLITGNGQLPVSDALISVVDPVTMTPLPDIATTNSDGVYLLENVSEGIYTLLVIADGYPYEHLENVSVFPDQETSDINFVLSTEGGGEVSGTVSDANTHLPIPYATIYFEDSYMPIFSIDSDSTGNYTSVPLPPGIYEITAMAIGYESQKIENVVIVSGQENEGINFHLIHK